MLWKSQYSSSWSFFYKTLKCDIIGLCVTQDAISNHYIKLIPTSCKKFQMKQESGEQLTWIERTEGMFLKKSC